MKTVMSVRFDEQTVKKIQAEAEGQGTTPASLIRKAVGEFLENLNGESLEARLADRLEALAVRLESNLATLTASEFQARLDARRAKHQEGGQ